MAVIDPGDGDPLDIASICIDGIERVVSTVHGRDVPPTRARAFLARARSLIRIKGIGRGSRASIQDWP